MRSAASILVQCLYERLKHVSADPDRLPRCVIQSLNLSISSSTQPILELLPLALAELRHLLLGHVVGTLDLVEGVVRVLLELFADLVDLLLPPQALLVLHLVQPPLLESVVGSLEATLGVAVDLVGVALSQVQSVESVVDTGSVEGGEFFLA
jgi:hypothetical protein